MAQKNEVRHPSNSPLAFETVVALANSGILKVPVQKGKEEAKKPLYIDRI